MHVIDRIANEVDRATDEIVQFTRDLVRIPTINPPGDEYDARGGELKLCSLSKQVRSVFELVRMQRVFDIHATRESAVLAFETSLAPDV